MKKSTYAAYETNKDAEQSGVWVTGFPGGTEVQIKSVRSIAFRELQQAQTKKNRAAFVGNNNSYPPAILDSILAEQAAELTSGWKNVSGRDGEDLPFTPQNALTLYTDLPSFRDRVLYYANEDETFRAAAFEALAGNSSRPSGTT